MALHHVFNGGSAASWGGWTTVTNHWQNLAAMSGVSAGDTIFVASDHVKTDYSSDVTVTLPNGCTIISVDRSTGARTPGAEETSSTAAVDMDINFGSYGYLYGLKIGNTSSSTNGYCTLSCSVGGHVVAESCDFRVANTTTVTAFRMCASAALYNARFTFRSCSFTSTSTASAPMLDPNTRSRFVTLENCSFATTDSDNDWKLFYQNNYGSTAAKIVNCDLSKFQYLSTDGSGKFELQRCKVHSSLSGSSGTMLPEFRAILVDCSSETDLNESFSQHYKQIDYYGTITSTGSVYRSAASGAAGTEYSLEMDSNDTTSSIYSPLTLENKLAIWHDASGSKTLTIYLGSDEASLTDADVFANIYHVTSNTTTPAYGTYVSTRGNGAAAGTSTYLKTGTIGEWTGTGPSTAYQIEIASINPAQPGYIYADVSFSKSGKKLWVDPAITLT